MGKPLKLIFQAAIRRLLYKPNLRIIGLTASRKPGTSPYGTVLQEFTRTYRETNEQSTFSRNGISDIG